MNSSLSAPMIPTLADREAEIAMLQSNYDEFITSSKMIEDELEAELGNAEVELTKCETQISILNSQLSEASSQIASLEGALCTAKSKYENEWKIRRASELAEDKSESFARQAEGSLKALRDECDAVHESLAFQEEEAEELKIEQEIEMERIRQEVEDLKTQLSVEKESYRHKVELLAFRKAEAEELKIEQEIDMESSRQEVEDLKTQLSVEKESYRHEVDDMKAEIERLRSKCEYLEIGNSDIMKFSNMNFLSCSPIPEEQTGGSAECKASNHSDLRVTEKQGVYIERSDDELEPVSEEHIDSEEFLNNVGMEYFEDAILSLKQKIWQVKCEMELTHEDNHRGKAELKKRFKNLENDLINIKRRIEEFNNVAQLKIDIERGVRKKVDDRPELLDNQEEFSTHSVFFGKRRKKKRLQASSPFSLVKGSLYGSFPFSRRTVKSHKGHFI